MKNNVHLGGTFGPAPVRRVLLPKVEFALEKFLQDRRKRPRPKELIDTSGEVVTPEGGKALTNRTSQSL